MVKFVKALYAAYVGSDASMFEINPVLKTSDDRVIAVDSKVTLDGNSLYRHPDYAAMRDTTEEDPTEVEAGEAGLNYVKLDGNVGCMVNGAGLAMATMDIIKLSGGEPANFLDVGGTADAERVEKAFRIILRDPAVKAIWSTSSAASSAATAWRRGRGRLQEHGLHRRADHRSTPGHQRRGGQEADRRERARGHSAILLQEAADKVAAVLA